MIASKNINIIDDIDNDQNNSDIWEDEHELLLKQWCDNAMCYKMMHEQSHKKYWCLNAWFNIPIIMISTLTGTGNFAIPGIKIDNNNIIYIIGALNLFGGLLATISTFIGSAQILESHRVASISWGKMSKKIQIELSKPKKKRSHAKIFIEHMSDEYDKIIETSPVITNDIINWFKNIIETGEVSNNNSLMQCINDFFCFPFGCYIKNNKTNLNHINIQNIDLPDIVGVLKPTFIFGKLSNIQSPDNNTNKSNGNTKTPSIIGENIIWKNTTHTANTKIIDSDIDSIDGII
jgi:hypothetical protein